MTANVAFARFKARRALRRRGPDLSDLEGAAYLGLVKAAQRFDVTRGARFTTYAAHWIRHELQEAIRRGSQDDALDDEDAPRVAPSELRARLERLDWRERVIADQVIAGLSRDEIAQEHGLTAERVRQILNVMVQKIAA